MVNGKVIELFEDTSKYHGYHYFNLEEPLNLEHQEYFRRGVKRLRENYDYYFKERCLFHGNPTINRYDEALDIANDNYTITDVEAGLIPISVLEYSYQILFCDKILDNLSKHKKNDLSKDNLFDMLDELGDINLKLTHYNGNVIADNYLPLKSDLEETVNALLMVHTVRNLFEVFERTQANQTRDEYNWKIIKWNIRSEAEVVKEDEYEGVLFAGLRYLRKLEINKQIPPTFKLQRIIDDYELTCLRDEYRYQFADWMGILEPDIATERIMNEFETNNFERQYKTLSTYMQKKFNVDSRIFLKDIAKIHDMKYNLGFDLNLGV